MELHDVWFVLIAVLWIGYFFLEGFDFGIGVLTKLLARDRKERRVLINTIGPVWDGNEVWLLSAGGATFAAFPDWYATLFSGFYLPLLIILLCLIVRGVAFEYRAKRPEERWQSNWEHAIFWTSLIPAVLWGVAFGNIVRGVKIDAHMEYVGGFWDLLNPFALLGGAVTLALFTFHGAVFAALKTVGDIRVRARKLALRLGPVAAVLALGFLIWTQARTGDGWSLVAMSVAVLALVGAIAAIAMRPGGVVVRLLGSHHRRRRGDALPGALPGRHAVLAERRVEPHRHQRLVHAVHAHDHDLVRGDRHAPGPALPGVDLLGVPQAHRHPAHRGRALTDAHTADAHTADASSAAGCRTWRPAAARPPPDVCRHRAYPPHGRTDLKGCFT